MRTNIKICNYSITKGTTSVSISRHLWYFSEEHVTLCLFDDDISFEIKRFLFGRLQEDNGQKKPTEELKNQASFPKDNHWARG